jgi:hypothetical protein
MANAVVAATHDRLLEPVREEQIMIPPRGNGA